MELIEKALSKSHVISVINWDNIVNKLKLNQVEERDISVKELMEVDEIFCTGITTAVGVASVGSVTYKRLD
ncbi:hypothetical protein GQ457_13G020710 [Hibiscus cannabinus]